MKKLILFAAILFAGISVVKAQEVAGPVVATLNVNLYSVQSLEINNATVNLDYKTKTEYESGQSATASRHLTVYSTGGFLINVKSEHDLIPNNFNTETINSNQLTVKASATTGNTTEMTSITEVPLKMAGATLFESVLGGTGLEYDVEYKGLGEIYRNKYFKGAPSGITTYTTTVTYTITPN